MKTFKSKFELIYTQFKDKSEALLKFLSHYRTTPHCTTGVSPAELQLGRKIRTRWDLLKFEVKNRFLTKQEKQKEFFHGHRKVEFEINEIVMAKDFRNSKWLEAKIIQKLGEVTYLVDVGKNIPWKRHADQLKKCNLTIPDSGILDSVNESVSDKTVVFPEYNVVTSVSKDSIVRGGETSQALPVPSVDSLCNSVSKNNHVKSNLGSSQLCVSDSLAANRPKRNIVPPKKLNL